MLGEKLSDPIKINSDNPIFAGEDSALAHLTIIGIFTADLVRIEAETREMMFYENVVT